MSKHKAIIWSIAGTDSGGGAGLTADARAADAFGVHLCPVVAAITAQNSLSVDLVHATPAAVLEAQLASLAEDMPPAAIKTGLLGSAENIRLVANWVRGLRQIHPQLQLVVDPVLNSSTGANFADDPILQAYREELLPLADLITPNEAEAEQLGLRAGQGALNLCITGGDTAPVPGWSLDWLQSPQASGWLALPRIDTPHNHATGCTFAASAASALALGFALADAVVLGKMAAAYALKHAYTVGQGVGPVHAQAGFALDPSCMPYMGWGDALPAICEPRLTAHLSARWQKQSSSLAAPIYALADSLPRLQALLEAGARLVQLRIKRPENAGNAWLAQLQTDIAAAVALAAEHGAQLFINDHVGVAMQAKAAGLHLGQEDWAALSSTVRLALLRSDIQLGISSHSLWELARARSLAPRYIACGPIWPTTTKDMPWLPQGLDNLTWWVAIAGCPVVGIGGVLELPQATQIACTGAAAACLVRGLGDDPAQSLPAWQQAFRAGWAAGALDLADLPELPHSSLPPAQKLTP